MKHTVIRFDAEHATVPLQQQFERTRMTYKEVRF